MSWRAPGKGILLLLERGEVGGLWSLGARVVACWAAIRLLLLMLKRTGVNGDGESSRHLTTLGLVGTLLRRLLRRVGWTLDIGVVQDQVSHTILERPLAAVLVGVLLHVGTRRALQVTMWKRRTRVCDRRRLLEGTIKRKTGRGQTGAAVHVFVGVGWWVGLLLLLPNLIACHAAAPLTVQSRGKRSRCFFLLSYYATSCLGCITKRAAVQRRVPRAREHETPARSLDQKRCLAVSG